MKVICKTNSPGYESVLTVNNYYTVIREYDNFYLIDCDMEFGVWIDIKYFMNKKEERKYKLDKLNET